MSPQKQELTAPIGCRVFKSPAFFSKATSAHIPSALAIEGRDGKKGTRWRLADPDATRTVTRPAPTLNQLEVLGLELSQYHQAALDGVVAEQSERLGIERSGTDRRARKAELKGTALA